MPQKDKKNWAVPAAALSAVALWGLAFPLIQVGLESFSPIMLGFVRFALASMLMILVLLWKYPMKEIARVTRAEWKPLLALGLLYVAIPNVAQNIGLEHGTSSIASVIQSSGPVMTLFFAVLLLREELTRTKVMGTIVAMAGTLLLVASGGVSLDNENFVSNIFILISAVSYGLGWVSAKRMLGRNEPILIIGLSLVLGTVVLGLAVPFEEPLRFEFDSISTTNILVLGFLCGAVSSVLYLGSLEHTEVSKQAFFIYLMPVFASLFAWLIKDETVEPWTVVCGVIIVAGIVVANRNPSRPSPR